MKIKEIRECDLTDDRLVVYARTEMQGGNVALVFAYTVEKGEIQWKHHYKEEGKKGEKFKQLEKAAKEIKEGYVEDFLCQNWEYDSVEIAPFMGAIGVQLGMEIRCIYQTNKLAKGLCVFQYYRVKEGFQYREHEVIKHLSDEARECMKKRAEDLFQKNRLRFLMQG